MLNTFLIALVDRQHGRFFRYNLQTRTLERLGEVVVDDVPKAVKGASWAGLADAKVARHIDEHLLAHLKHVVHEMTTKYHDKAVILGGPEEVVAQFEKELPQAWQERVEAIIHPQGHLELKDLEERIKQAADKVYEAHVSALLTQITESGQPGGKGVQGYEPVLEALNLKQAQLIMMNNQPVEGYLCAKDGGLSLHPGQCAGCFADLVPAENLHDAILAKAAEQDAEVVIVADKSILPAQSQGIVALKRYA